MLGGNDIWRHGHAAERLGEPCNQGIAWGQEAEAPARVLSRNKVPVDLVVGSTLPRPGGSTAEESRAC